MAGVTRLVKFAEGTVTDAPEQVNLIATALAVFDNTSDFVTAKGDVAAEGDIFYNTGSDLRAKINFYDDVDDTWRELRSEKINQTALSAPTVGSDNTAFYELLSTWIDTATSELYMATDVSTGAAQWSQLATVNTSQTFSGAKSFSAITNITNTTQSSSIGTGAMIVAGGLGVAKNLNVGENLTVTGDLTVNGTTVTLNTSTLDVEDLNVSVNVGGNQASADGAAGLTVEMSDATNVGLVYDSSLASRWKAGDIGSLVELVNVSGAQVITNKDLDFETMTNARRMAIPKGTFAALDALTDKEALLAYDSTNQRLVINTGSGWIANPGGNSFAGGVLSKDGSPAAVSYGFINDASNSTGLFFIDNVSASARVLGLSAGGNGLLTMSTDNGVSLSSGVIFKADTINESTTAAGVTIDSVLLKDGLLQTLSGTAGSPALRAGDTDTGFFDSGTDELGFSSGGTQTLAFDSTGLKADQIDEFTTNNGVVVDGVTLKDGGAEFVNGGSVLDNYEEGTWTVNILSGGLTGGSNTGTGYYTIIGDMLYFTLSVGITSHTNSGGAMTINLPASPDPVQTSTISIQSNNSFAVSSGYTPAAYIDSTTDNIVFRNFNTNTTGGSFETPNVHNGNLSVRLCGHYKIA